MTRSAQRGSLMRKVALGWMLGRATVALFSEIAGVVSVEELKSTRLPTYLRTTSRLDVRK